jgi:small subunit ribosomal protein S1
VSEPDEEEDFEKLFEASTQATKARRFEKGQTIEGTIVTIGAESALVDVGGKSEAEIDVAELKDDEGDIEVAVGDRIQAVVLSTSGGLKLSRRLARGAATSQQLLSAFQAGLPVEGKVERAVKGGYEVRIARQRAFCPQSQIDIVPTADPTSHDGRVYQFRIIEYKDNRNLVVSRRALLEEQQRAVAAEVRKSIVEGAVLRGRVASVREFGAFVDLGGGIQGLLHVSEMGWSRVADTAQVANPGDEITVKVLRVDKDKISLGLKQLLADPWSTVPDTYAVGTSYKGKVTRVADFGVFVELEPGVEGLIPLSETGIARGGDVKKAFPAGTSLDVVVLEVDGTTRRIRLSATAVQKLREADEVREYTERVDATPSDTFGSLADKLRDALSPRQK